MADYSDYEPCSVISSDPIHLLVSRSAAYGRQETNYQSRSSHITIQHLKETRTLWQTQEALISADGVHARTLAARTNQREQLEKTMPS